MSGIMFGLELNYFLESLSSCILSGSKYQGSTRASNKQGFQKEMYLSS